MKVFKKYLEFSLIFEMKHQILRLKTKFPKFE